MKTKIVELFDKEQTIKEMDRLVKTYYKDLIDYEDYSLKRFFNLIKNYPYKTDKAPDEELRRPKYFTLKKNADCKKKAIMIASFLKLKNIPYRFITSSARPDKRIHHVFVQGYINDEWINLDATYRDYKIGQVKKVTRYEIERP